ncbi:MAG: hypothetical protein WA138_16055 [Parvibaculum sp.]
MASKFSGIAKLEYQPAGGAWSAPVVLGVPLSDSPSVTFEPQEVENSKGQMLYAGNKDSSEFNFSDFTNFAAVETLMEADTEVDVRLTFLDNTTEIIHTAALLKVKKVFGAAVGGRNSINVKFQNFRIT